MNKITIEDDKVISLISLENNILNIDKDMDLLIFYKNSNQRININIKDNVSVKIVEVIEKSCVNNTYTLLSNSYLELDRISIDSNILTTINLNDINSNILYNYKTVNVSDNENILNINHNSKDTKSYIYNHAINIFDKKLSFIVNANIEKESINTISHQDNKIITLDNNSSKIIPNLKIDNNEIEASHAAYIGYFDSEDIFYVKTRGLDDKTINRVLSLGFLMSNMNLCEEEKNIFINTIKDYWR